MWLLRLREARRGCFCPNRVEDALARTSSWLGSGLRRIGGLVFGLLWLFLVSFWWFVKYHLKVILAWLGILGLRSLWLGNLCFGSLVRE